MAGALFERILALNAEAATSGEYEVAYHLLAAGLHAAELQASAVKIDEVMRLAEQQAAAVDASPAHRLGTDSAVHRGTTPLYRPLIGTAKAIRARVTAEAAGARNEIHRPPVA